MVLTNQMELDVGKTLCQETTSAWDTWVIYVKRYYHKLPNESRLQEFGFLMLPGPMVRVGADLNFMAIMKDIRNDFAAGEVRTHIALNSYTDEEATIRSVGLIYNQNCLNLEVLKQI